MRRLRSGVAVAVLAAGLAGCSAGSAKSVTPQACVDALDQADAAFTTLGQNLTTVKQAFDQASSGDPSGGTATLQGVQRIDAAPYKAAEAKCRASAK